MKQYDERVETIKIDVSNVSTSKQLHEILKKKLGFPNFYGMNWDAFWDTITGIVEMPQKIIIIGWENVVQNIPDDAKMMMILIEKLNKKHPTWGCEVEYK